MKRDVALVGCGAIAQQFYLPALAKLRDRIGDLWLVDPDERSRAAAGAVLAGKAAPSLSEVTATFDFVIVATPNAFHFAVAQAAMNRGAHVLIEKPITVLPEEAKALVDLAVRTNRTLAVNQTRRFFPIASALRKRVAAGDFGSLRSGSHYEGEKLAWPFASGAAFSPSAKRTGVVMDLGVHVVDYHHYILGGAWSAVAAKHDGFAGPEGLAEMHFGVGGAKFDVRLSRYLPQSNTARLVFERATIEIGAYDLNRYVIADPNGNNRKALSVGSPRDYNSLAVDVVTDFLEAGETGRTPIGDAASTLPVLQLLDTSYAIATRYPEELGAV